MATSAINVKKNNYHDNPKDFCIYTPPDICNFLYDISSPYHCSNILDICCGSGNLSKPFFDKGKKLVGIDVEDVGYKYGQFIQRNFLKPHPEDYKFKYFKADLIISNPPFNGCPGRKLFSYEILKRILQVFGLQKPIILFTLMGLRLNRRYGAKREGELEEFFEKGLELSSIISMPIDAFSPGSKTKGQQWEILCFNMPKLKPHYWYSKKLREKYLNL